MSTGESARSTFWCAEGSRRAGEQVFGTAPRAQVWLALEYRGVWHADAFAESHLPEDVKAHVSAVLAAPRKARARLQLIRRPGDPRAGLAFYVARACEDAPELYRFTLGAYDDLLALDLDALLAGDARYANQRSELPLLLVCTNAERDKCCGRFGPAVCEALAALPETDVWLTTHLGGHRFAANVACLPHGLVYGRVSGGEAPYVAQDYRRGAIYLARYRGRSCYAAHEQAAEYAAREVTGLRAIGALRLAGSRALEPDVWDVAFRLPEEEGRELHVRVARGAPRLELFTSCRDAQPSPVPQWSCTLLDGG